MSSKPLTGNAVIGQSGGPTAVINQSLVGVIEGLAGSDAVTKILGARHAVSGIIKNDFIELQGLPQDRLDRIAMTPSAALGSSRDKPDAEYCKKIFDVFAKQNVRYFFYIGGNDSSDTCRIVNELAKANNYELRCFHVPKTIDNDLVHNDHTPGFGSAAKFVAQAFIGDNLDNRSLPGIKINIIMGRHAGFLTAAAMLGKQHEDDGPHLVYVPEATFDLDKFKADVAEVYGRLGRCLIAVSEGIHDKDGTPMASKLAADVEKDAHGNVQLSGTGALGDHLANASGPTRSGTCNAASRGVCPRPMRPRHAWPGARPRSWRCPATWTARSPSSASATSLTRSSTSGSSCLTSPRRPRRWTPSTSSTATTSTPASVTTSPPSSATCRLSNPCAGSK